MNVTRENIGELSALITVDVQKADYTEAVEKQLKDLRKKANMPGFRQGMVPKGLIKKMYQKSVMAEEINKLLSQGLYDYISKEKIDILGQPMESDQQEEQDFDVQEDFTFKFDIGLAPQIELAIDKAIEVPYYPIKQEDKEAVDKAIEELRMRFGETQTPETIEEGCFVSAKCTQLDEEGKPLQKGINNQDTFFSMDDIQLKTILKKLIGLKIGDKCVFDPMRAIKDAEKVGQMLKITTEEAQALKAEFEFEMGSFSKTTLAELNEDFYKKAFPENEIMTEEAMRAHLEAGRQKQYDQQSDNLMLNQAVNIIIEKADMKLPDAFLKRWILGNADGKMTEEQLDAQYSSYAQSVKWQLLQKHVAEKYDIKVEPQEVEDYVRSNFMGYLGGGNDLNEEMKAVLEGLVQNSLKDEQQMERVYNQLFDTKLMMLFKDTLTLKKKKALSFDEFTEKSQEIIAAV